MDDKKVIVISGGSRGLGLSIVQALLKEGHVVATFSRSKTEFVEQLESEYKSGEFMWEALDSTDYEKLPLFLKKVSEQFGHIDGLINNAGVGLDGVLTLQKSEDISRLLQTNLEGVIRLSQSAIKYMLVRKQGVIINISSIIGIRGYSGLAVYSATKAGLDGFTRALARELGGRNIRVNSIAPGYLETDMSSKLSEKQRTQIIRRTPLGRLGHSQDITGLVKFLLTAEAAFITGQTLVVDGGITC